jgi:hypothetical protein
MGKETTMQTSKQCQAYAAEYQILGMVRDISIRRATALMGISRSWVTLAHQLDRLAEIERDESKAA